MTREQIEAEIADLKAKNEAAPGWGAAVGARSERIKGLEQALRAMDRPQCSAGRVDALALADEYETGMNRALASGYEEFGPLWESQHRLVIKALRSFGAAQPVAWRYRHRGDPWSVCDTEPEDVEPRRLEVQPLYAAKPPAAPVETESRLEAGCSWCGGDKPCGALECGYHRQMRGPLSRSSAGNAQDPTRDELISDIACAETMLSEHIERFHDFDYQPHEVPPELESLRQITHHLAGSLINNAGEPVMPAVPQTSGMWQPIETAPKDGSRFLATGGGLDDTIEVASYNERVGAWNTENYTLDDRDDDAEGYNRPSHWQPMPSTMTRPLSRGGENG